MIDLNVKAVIRGSLFGLNPVPVITMYCASKYAVQPLENMCTKTEVRVVIMCSDVKKVLKQITNHVAHVILIVESNPPNTVNFFSSSERLLLLPQLRTCLILFSSI
ncbi:hypothetical protein ALC62_08738 [Cyphomyrmex costatus]|uniref:Uncharacterized protein n=1 Tax=Cyphomyrmex costatus TaxID=456900 RepID=A0A195CK34_9HYME|nr:hypothetical protein ALC62_08738 [Cyphomyrmex costatus]